MRGGTRSLAAGRGLLISESSWGSGVRAGGVGVRCEESASGANKGLRADRYSPQAGRGRYVDTPVLPLNKLVFKWDIPGLATRR